MGALKKSAQSCYFDYNARSAALKDEVEFFQRCLGPKRAMEQLLALRHAYPLSFLFVARCVPALVRLHMRTAFDNRFPGTVREIDI